MAPPTRPADKAALLAMIQTGYEHFDALLATLRVEQMTIPGVNGFWSIKDNLAHLAAWQNFQAARMEGVLKGAEPPLLAPGLEDEDAINEYLYQQHKNRPLPDVLAEFRASYQRVLAATEALSQEALNRLFPGTATGRQWEPTRWATRLDAMHCIRNLFSTGERSIPRGTAPPATEHDESAERHERLRAIATDLLFWKGGLQVLRQAQLPKWRGSFKWQIEAQIEALQAAYVRLRAEVAKEGGEGCARCQAIWRGASLSKNTRGWYVPLNACSIQAASL